MNATFSDGLDELYHHAKFEEDHTTLVGCRCENVVFVLFCLHCSESSGPFARGGYTLNSYCVAVYGSIFISFAPFFRSDCPFRITRQFLFSSLGGATIFE